MTGGPRHPLAAVGARMRQAREAAGMGQRVLGEKIGQTQACVSRWESGERDPGVMGLLLVAYAAGTNPVALLGDLALPAPASDGIIVSREDLRAVVLRVPAGVLPAAVLRRLREALGEAGDG